MTTHSQSSAEAHLPTGLNRPLDTLLHMAKRAGCPDITKTWHCAPLTGMWLPALAGELKTGYLEKRVGEHSGRQSVPGEAFKWQKRYFVLTEPKGMLYYFKSADDPPNYRGVINLRCAMHHPSLHAVLHSVMCIHCPIKQLCLPLLVMMLKLIPSSIARCVVN